MSKLIPLFIALLACLNVAEAGTGAIPKGPDVLILKPNLLFKGGDIKVMTGDTDVPSVVAKDAERGSAYLRKADGTWYKKTATDGNDTNWQLFIFGALGLGGLDECVPRWDGAGTGVLQDSLLCISDLGYGTGFTGLDVDNLTLDGNTLSSTDVNGNITLDPNGTGKVVINSNLEVNGTYTTVSAATMEVTNATISANVGGTQSTADTNDSGLIISMSDATNATIHYDSTLASKFAAGEIGSTKEIITTSDVQDITAKTLLEVDNLQLNGNTIASLDAAGPIILAANGAGIVDVNSNMEALDIDSIGDSTFTGSLEADNIRIDGNTISSTNVAGSIILDPNGGATILPDLTISQPAYINALGHLVSQDISLTADVAGILPIANGGTNSSTALNNDRVMISSGGSIVEQAAMTDGQLMIGSTGAAPALATLTGTANQAIVTNGAGTITLSTPQDIHTGASPTFVGATLTGLTLGSVPFISTGGLIAEDNAALFWDAANDSLLLGDNTVDTSAMFELTSTGKGMLTPRMTTAQRDAITVTAARDGLLIYDTDVAKFSYYSDIASAWKYISGLTLSSTDLAVADYTEAQYPHDQLTVTDATTGLEKVRIETGNDSFLSNGSFEHATYNTGWTDSGTGTASLETTEVWEGGKSFKYVNAGGTQEMDLSQSKTLTQYEGVTVGATCMVKSNSAKVKLCVGNTADDEKDCVYHDGNDMWKKMQAIMMPDSTGQLQLSIKSDLNEDAIVYVDSCEWSNNPLKIKGGIDTQSIYYSGHAGLGSTNIRIPYYTTLQQNTDVDKLLKVDNSATLGMSFTAVKDCIVDATYMGWSASSNTQRGFSLNSTELSTSIASINQADKLVVSNGSPVNTSTGVTTTVRMKAGDVLRPHTDSSALILPDAHLLRVVATEINEEILTAADIVSSETMAFQFKGTPVTESDPVGTFNYYSVGASVNNPVICATDTQTISPNNLDGVRFQALPYDTASNCIGSVSHYRIQVGKGFKGINTYWYKDANRTTALNVPNELSIYTGTLRIGAAVSYDEKTGIMIIDGKIDNIGGSNDRLLGNNLTNGGSERIGFFHFHASKNPVVNAVATIPLIDYSWENEFSARIDNLTSVCSVDTQGKSFIDYCTRTAAGRTEVFFKAGFFTQVPSITATAEGSDVNIGLPVVVTTTKATFLTEISSNSTDADRDFHIHVSRQGSDYRERGSAAAIIAQPTCFIKHVEASGVAAGTLPITYTTRPLNTLSGNCDGISLVLDQVTIANSGTYKISFTAPAFSGGTGTVQNHKAKLVGDPNGTPFDSIIGSTEYAHRLSGVSLMQTSSKGSDEVVISGSTEFELQHRCDVAAPSDGMGTPSSYGDNEIYAQLEITRIR